MKVGIRELTLFASFVSIIMLCLIFDVELMLVMALGIWLSLMLFAIYDIKNRSMLLVFLITFFIFLLGRDLVQQIFKYKVDIFEPKVQFHAYFSYVISLLTIGIFYKIFELKEKNIYEDKEIIKKYNENKSGIAGLSLFLYYISWIFAIISKISISFFVAERGFTDYYTDYSEYLHGNNILYLISKIELIMPVAWIVYLATGPNKKEIKLPLILYIIYLVISLGTGQRSTAMLGLVFISMYFIYRNGEKKEKWINKNMIIIFLLCIPAVLIFASYYNILREGGSFADASISESFINFFYDQGVTSNVLKRAYIYKDLIPNNNIYAFEFLHSGIFARLLGIPIYHGNTIEHALYGGSFTHSLGYVIMGESYLLGRGSGSCYIAELYQDLGYLGIILGNIVYAYLLSRIARPAKKYRILYNSVCFTLVIHLLWAPRGSFSAFITQNFIPTTLFVFIFVFGLNKYMSTKRNKDINQSEFMKL